MSDEDGNVASATVTVTVRAGQRQAGPRSNDAVAIDEDAEDHHRRPRQRHGCRRRRPDRRCRLPPESRDRRDHPEALGHLSGRELNSCARRF
ncbi:MAG: hypothetical protein MZV70_05590 [Desulfobacterales bacterium]|nr:hypothetical protein [Desulfobacterales bacterium]